ncbi:polyphosphate kinase [Yersinia enterocolitica]|nr:polyphosphate kinase [Yersinia enterocolitica]ELI8071351.1 polyphosphate kinase [Yersinia enterocolitica]ELZ3991881.1 polyphosphate kinase [Yersinia enterocolitica]HDL7130627.1 polyphosphate kinase [Yersinia enterocolitica]HDL7382129.1 polyphosphate kinase [Yersinia enterocolitica]
MHMPSKNKREYPTEITNAQLKYLITAFENNMAEFYPVGREAQIARELLSQREQNLSLSRQLDVMTAAAQALRDEMYKGDAKLAAITAAKPEALPRHIFSMLVNELRDVPTIGCKRELIIGVLNRHGVIAEPVQCDPPATE